MHARAGWFAVSIALCFVLAGCGGGTAKVRGKVTFQEKTVVWGTVILVDSSGAYHQAEIDLNGNYELLKIPTGSVKIGVSSPNPEPTGHAGEKTGKGDKGGRGEKGGIGGTKGKVESGFVDPREEFLKSQGKGEKADRPKPPPGAWFALDPKLADPTTSGLTGEVNGGSAELNISIK